MTQDGRVFGYYPGCELRTRARALDLSARRACRALGIRLQEMDDWTCCGGLVPQVRDDYAGLLAPTRILVEARAQGFDDLVALCAFCFNTLRRAAFRLQRDPEARRRLGAFLELEELSLPRVLHLLEVFRDEVGFDRIREAVRRPLSGLRVAPYYGCLLLRPGREVNLDDPEDPTVLEGLLDAMGCDVTAFRARCECCGSYHIVTGAQVVARCADLVLEAAAESGAQVLVTSCPVCQFNLEWRRPRAGDSQPPVVYFPQLLALALGDPVNQLGFDQAALTVLAPLFGGSEGDTSRVGAVEAPGARPEAGRTVWT